MKHDIAHDTVKEKNIVGFFSDLEVEGLATGNVRRIMAAGFDTVPKILKMTEADFKDVDGFKKKMVDKKYFDVLIFPRYHQLEVLRKLKSKIKEEELLPSFQMLSCL